MKPLSLAVPALAAALLLGCPTKPTPKGAQPSTTIQHDDANPATEQLPTDHPKLGDGASSHDAPLPSGHPEIDPADRDSKALLAKVEAMKKELEGKPKTLEVLVALGSLYYDNGRYLDAIDYYRQTIDQGKPEVEALLALRKQAGAVKPVTLEAAGCDRAKLHDTEPIVAMAKAHQQKGELGAALTCLQEAVRPVVMAHTRRGNAFYLIGNPAEAVAEHEKAIAIDPGNPESLFFRGAIYFDSMGDDVPKLVLAKKSWEAFLVAAPDSPRAKAVKAMLPQLEQAIALGGVSHLPHPDAGEEQIVMEDGPGGGAPGQPMAPPLDPGAADAIQNTELTPEVIQAMGPILDEATAQVAKGDLEGAKTNLVRVFPFVMSQGEKFEPAFRARTLSLMSLYMASKGAPMAQQLLGKAVLDDAASVDALGDALSAKGDATHARTLWNAVVAGAPDYAAKAKVAAKGK